MRRESLDDIERGSAGALLAERELLAALGSAVSAALVQGRSLPETLHRCCEAIVNNLDAAFARIWTLNEETNVLELRASAGMYTHLDGAHGRVPVGQFKIGLIAQERKPHLTNQVIGDARVSDQQWAEREGMTAFAGYPLVVEDQLVGVVALFSRQPLTKVALQALEVIADGIALGIERQRAEAKLREQTEVVETINRIGQLLSAELDQQKLVQAVTDAATELTGAQFGSFCYNAYDEQGVAHLRYTSSAPERAIPAALPPLADLFAPEAQTIRLNDVKNDARYDADAPAHNLLANDLPIASYLAVPVVSRQGAVLGGLCFGHAEVGVFTERHARIVEGLAAQTAIAMDNARLYNAAQQALKEREELLNSEQAARREAETASRAKDEFLGLLSHELRTPLNAILGWTRMLNTDNLDEETFARAIETIDRNAQLQARLIEDMLDVSRIISGKLRLDAQPVDLTTVINAAVDTSRPAADAKGIRVQMVLDFGAGLVLGDAVRLQQVIWNLLSNAIKFTPKQGRVQVQLERIHSYVEMTVSDTGPGIEEEFLPHVFERFRQADSTSTKKYGGLGLGLAIVRHLVELHGGTVEANNRTDRQGAIFSVRLPVMVVRAATGRLAADAQRVHPTVSGTVPFDCPPALEGVKVLAVDDEADARELLTMVLKRCGAEIKTCGSVAEALAALPEYQPDVLVSDIGMPGEDGYHLIKQVRAATWGARLPAVALTAYARVEDRLQALSAGYNMHVPKPVEPAELAVVIASLVNRRNNL